MSKIRKIAAAKIDLFPLGALNGLEGGEIDRSREPRGREGSRRGLRLKAAGMRPFDLQVPNYEHQLRRSLEAGQSSPGLCATLCFAGPCHERNSDNSPLLGCRSWWGSSGSALRTKTVRG